jgi:hypothetical protein
VLKGKSFFLSSRPPEDKKKIISVIPLKHKLMISANIRIWAMLKPALWFAATSAKPSLGV